jgi:hypothetical protein
MEGDIEYTTRYGKKLFKLLPTLYNNENFLNNLDKYVKGIWIEDEMSGCECGCVMETFYRICDRNGLKDLRNKYYRIFMDIHEDDEDYNSELLDCDNFDEYSKSALLRSSL